MPNSAGRSPPTGDAAGLAPVTVGFDALELFRALGRHDVEYVTVGGVAIQAYGGQRMTQDLDVVIAASRENMGRLATALLDLDARILGPDGQRSKSVPSAAMLASGDQRHLITEHGPLDVLTLPAHWARSRTYAVARTSCSSAGCPSRLRTATTC